MLNDPIADMLTQIVNAQMVKKPEVVLHLSKFKIAILEVLKHYKLINDFQTKNNNLSIELKYNGTKPQITKIKKISKPGLRIYTNYKRIPVVKQGLGLVIISTSQGVMAGHTARKKNLGGEIICEIY